MKTMNTLLIISFLFLGYSCSNNELSENKNDEILKEEKINKLASSREEESIISELHLHEMYLENELLILEYKKEQLIAFIEEGDEEKIKELEEVQKTIELHQSQLDFVKEDIYSIKLPRLPKPTPCAPPLDFDDDSWNCPTRLQKLNVLTSTNNVEVVIVNEIGDVIAEPASIEPSEIYEDGIVHYFETELQGEITIQVSKDFELGENGEANYTFKVYKD